MRGASGVLLFTRVLIRQGAGTQLMSEQYLLRHYEKFRKASLLVDDTGLCYNKLLI